MENVLQQVIIFSDSKILVIIYFLHCVFPLFKKSTHDVNGKKGFTKYSVQDSQNKFDIESILK